MNVDQKAKRYWPLIVCAMLGIAAYFQASAIGNLVSARIGGEAHVPEIATAAPVAVDVPLPTAKPILERNPFDSSTGAIERPDTEQEDEPDEEAPSSGVSECSKGRVVLIAQNEDPNWEFASIDPGSGTAKLLRVGDSFEGFVIESLSWDRVYLTENGKRCFLGMGNTLSESDAATLAPKDDDDKDLSKKIRKVSATQFEMDRETMDAILGTRGGLLGRTRATPFKKGDAVVGLELGRVHRDSMLQHLGLEEGDVLQSMSGTQITSPEKLMAAYERMQQADRFRMRILRDGVPKSIEYKVQ